MIYVMSDIHGQYEKYLAMLKEIDLKDEDELYILGDVVDRGPHPIKILQDMSMRANVFPLLGNHDATALYLLKRLNVEVNEENCETQLSAEDMRALAMWLADGGDTTLSEFRRLPIEERQYLLEYLDEFLPYEELTVGDNRFVLVHGGLAGFDPAKGLDEYGADELVWTRPGVDERYWEDRLVILGHTPTQYFGNKGRMFVTDTWVDIDTGAACGGSPMLLRLDDMCPFYADEDLL